MKSTFLTLLTIFLMINAILAQQNDKEIIYFDNDKFELTENIQSQLNKIIKKIKEKEIAQIKVNGHTDSDGSNIYNETLSKKRAMTVLNYLLANGIEKNKIKVGYFGERQPNDSSDNEHGKQQNRRVEIVIEYGFSIPKGFIVTFKEFHVNPNSDTIITLDTKGTLLHIPKNCFIDRFGKPINETVTLKYREFTNSAEMAFSSIPMTYKHDNQEYFFNSSGMFEIIGTVNDNHIEISKNKPMKIDYALAKKNPEISFFKLKEKESNWQKIQDIEPIKKEGIKAHGGELVEVAIIDGEMKIEDNGNRQNGTMLAEGADAGHTYPDIVKGLNIETFGVYNCDQIYRLPNRVEIIAKYVDSEGKEIDKLHVLSMIDLQYNGAFSFNPKNFICDAKGQNVLALFTKSGDLYLLDKTEFANMNIQKSGQYTFTMKNMTDEIKSTKDFANYLGIKM